MFHTTQSFRTILKKVYLYIDKRRFWIRRAFFPMKIKTLPLVFFEKKQHRFFLKKTQTVLKIKNVINLQGRAYGGMHVARKESFDVFLWMKINYL